MNFSFPEASLASLECMTPRPRVVVQRRATPTHRKPFHLGRVVFCLVFASFSFVVIPTAMGQSLTPKEKQSLQRIKSNIDRAGKLFKSKKFKTSAQSIQKAMDQIGTMSSNARPILIEALQPEQARLAKAHQLLTEAGQKLAKLKPLPDPINANEAAVSFKEIIAPILVSKCGNCHVNRSRGDFSMSTFEALAQSTMLAFGKPDDSRLIEVIENGEMPKGGLKIETEELKKLRTWIRQGAKYDGDSPTQNLNEFVASPTPTRKRMEPTQPTGNETVSFGLHVAPILVENCGPCHIFRRNPRGNFSMANFRSLLAGGDGGNPIDPGKSSQSELIKRLRGDDAEVMPPTGKLDDKIIDVIATWIDEGAAFDGRDPRLEIQTIIATARAGAMSHEELAADRIAKAAKTWTLVMDNVASISIPSENFLVTGSTNESRLTDVSLLCEKMTPKIAKALRADSNRPLVKGNIAIFVFDKRYDFSEFGKMVEQRDFPKSVTAHWGFTTVDAYATVLMTRNQKAEDIEIQLAQQIAAIHIAGLASDVPRWFADGVGIWTTKKVFSRDERLKKIDSEAETIAATMLASDDFVNDRMPSDKAALVGYLFIKQLRSKTSSYHQLMKAMEDGKTFEDSFMAVYGKTPSQLIKGQ